MIIDASLIALILACLGIAALLAGASVAAWDIQRNWNPASGSARQVMRERKISLVSALAANALVFQLIMAGFLLVVFDRLASVITGVMCGAGVFAVHWAGYPALFTAMVTTVAAGVWLVVNRLDMTVPHQPMVRGRSFGVLVLAALSLAQAALVIITAANLDPDVITTCCGSLFDTGGQQQADIAAVDPSIAMAAFFIMAGITVILGITSRITERFIAFGAVSLAMLPGFLVFMVSALSIYIYALPTHHCPFDVVQKEYGYVGLILYGVLMAGVITGAGAGVSDVLGRRIDALSVPSRRLARTLGAWSLVLWITLAVASAALIIGSPLSGG